MPRPRRINRNTIVYRCIIDCFCTESKTVVTDMVDIPEKIFESNKLEDFILSQPQFFNYDCTKVIDVNVQSTLKRNYYITEYDFFLKANSAIIE